MSEFTAKKVTISIYPKQLRWIEKQVRNGGWSASRSSIIQDMIDKAIREESE